jgi:hypothetical protein
VSTELELAESRLKRLDFGESKVAIYSSDAPESIRVKLADTCYLLDLQTIARAWLDIDRPLVMAAKDLLAACEAALPWVAIATSDHDPHRHPKSVQNARDDAAILMAAIRKAKGTPNA